MIMLKKLLNIKITFFLVHRFIYLLLLFIHDNSTFRYSQDYDNGDLSYLETMYATNRYRLATRVNTTARYARSI